jgi:hypothetical protein
MPTRPYFYSFNLNGNQLIKARFEVSATPPLGPVPGQQYFNSTSNTFMGWNGTDWVDLSMIVTNAMVLRGEIANAASNPAFPANPVVGDTWRITTQAGQVGTEVVEVGDELVYSTSGWFTLQRNLVAATQTLAGYIRLATPAEANAGLDAGTAISPATLASFLISLLYARKFRVVIPSLAANTTTPVTHGLNLANMEDVQVSFVQGGVPIELYWVPVSGNAISITSSAALTNVTVVALG